MNLIVTILCTIGATFAIIYTVYGLALFKYADYTDQSEEWFYDKMERLETVGSIVIIIWFLIMMFVLCVGGY